MRYWPVGDGKLSQVVTHHLRLNFHLVEDLPVVYSDYAADHFRQNNLVPQMRFYRSRLLASRSFLFGLSQLFYEQLMAGRQPTLEAPAWARWKQVHQLVQIHIEEGLKVHSPI